ncbi:hypothetical protein CHU98_g5959 [Xylaria longipes]|nr:hypothetical protein CHU98_g5959 [Xylaria longipes]
MASITTQWPQALHPVPISCAALHYIYLSDETKNSDLLAPSAFEAYEARYPACALYRLITGLEAAGTYVVVGSRLGEDRDENTAAGTLALVLHAVLVEIYLHLTPAETARLRRISYQRQLERGYKNPGSAGVVAQWLGDAEKWHPSTSSVQKVAFV